MIVDALINVAIGYLLGSVATGLIVGYAFTGGDIRQRGSGKTGTTNVLRTAGPVAAALVVVGDVAKGAVPALLGRFLFDDYGVAAAGALAAVAGHVYPVFAGFRGGRGVATAYGGFLPIAPLVALALPLAAAGVVGATRYVSLMSVGVTPLAAIATVAFAIAGWVPPAVGWYAGIVAAFILYTHRPNIRRLLAGNEPKLGSGGDRPATG